MKPNDIIARMDGFALELLEAAPKAEALQDRIAVFKEIGRWVMIKNGLEDSDGEGIRDYRHRLKGNAPDGKDDKRPSTFNRVGKPPVALEPDDPSVGDGLAQLRARIPRSGDGANNRRIRSLSQHTGGPPFAHAGRDRSVSAELPGTPESVGTDANGGGKL